MTLAPTLRAMSARQWFDPDDIPKPSTVARMEQADRELRALLAVARAAAHHMDAAHYPLTAGSAPSVVRVYRAVARLQKVSRATPKRPAPRRSAPRTPTSMPRNDR